jgi:hypothetical protein
LCLESRICGYLDLQQAIMPTLTLGNTCPSTILKLFALLLHFVGQKKGIGTRMCMMFHGMYFCHVWQILMTSDNVF